MKTKILTLSMALATVACSKTTYHKNDMNSCKICMTEKEIYKDFSKIIRPIIEDSYPEKFDECYHKDFIKNLLFTAVKKKSLAFLDFIKKTNIDLNSIKNDKRQTLLHIAIKHSDLATIKKIVALNIKNSKDCDGNSVIHYAVMRQKEILQYIAENYKKYINEKNNLGLTPLHVVAEYGIQEDAAILIEQGADKNIVDEDYMKPIDIADNYGRSKSFNNL